MRRNTRWKRRGGVAGNIRSCRGGVPLEVIGKPALVNGEYFIVSVNIQDDVMKSGDGEMLQDLIKAAVNDATQKAKKTSQEEMEKITGGLGVPGLF